MSITYLFEKVEMRQEPVTKSDTRKDDLSIISCSIRRFAAQFLKNLLSKQRQKMKKKLGVLKKRYIKKFLALKMTNISQEGVKTTSNVFISGLLLTIIQPFWKFWTFFWVT